MWLRYAKKVDLSGLHDELLDAGIAVLRVEGTVTDVAVEVADGTRAEDVNAVVVAHDPATSSATRATRIQNERTLKDRVDQALGNLEGAWANWATLTAAQKDAAMRLDVRVTAAVGRLQLRELDAVG